MSTLCLHSFFGDSIKTLVSLQYKNHTPIFILCKSFFKQFLILLFIIMKKTTPIILLVIASITSRALAQAPTLTFADFPFATQDMVCDYSYQSAAVPNPTVGTNQTWNYANQTGGTVYSFTYYAYTNPQLPALTHIDQNLFEPIAGGLGLDYTHLLSLNSNGFQIIGRQYPAQRYGIGGLTGNNLDSLTMGLQTIVYPTPITAIKFPMTMGTAWTSNARRSIMSKLTLTNYGIIRSNFEKRSREVRVDSVVGWGDVTSAIGAQASIPYRCLLVNRYTTVSDSFYLGGGAASAALLQAFGLAQNQKSNSTRRLFLRAGEIYPQMLFHYNSTDFTSQSGFSCNQHGQTVATEQYRNATASLQVFPSPNTGEQFQIIPSKQEPMRLTVTDISGSTVADFHLNASSSAIQIPLTQMLPKGIYVINVEYLTSKTGEQSKLVVQ